MLAASHIPARAAPRAVQDGTNIYTLAPAAGDVWQLLGNAYVSDGASAFGAKVVPSTLTINGTSAGSTITMNDGADHYAYFAADGGTVLSLSNVTLTGGNRAKNGAVFDSSGSLTLNTAGTVAFTNNTTAIRAYGTVTVNGSLSASGNTASNDTDGKAGGSVVFARHGSVVITDSVNLSSNIATGNGGAIWAADTGMGVSIGNSGSTVSLTGNKAGYEADGTLSSNRAQGGAIFAAKAISIYGSTITISDNWANSGGGAIASLHGGAITIGDSQSSVTLKDNRSGYNRDGSYAYGGGGGAIWSSPNGAPISILGASISVSGNWATSDGGAIASGGAVSMGNAGGSVSIAGNRAGYTFDDGALADAKAMGGAISTAATVTLSGQTITVSDNMATHLGGGIYAYNGVSIGGASSTVIISGNKSGYDTGMAAINDTSQGGGIWSSGAVKLMGASITLSGNYTAGYDGGGIFTTKTVSIGDSGSIITIRDNVAGYNDSGAVTGDYATGGAISSGDTTTLTGSTITLAGNKAADYGGGIFSSKDVVVNGFLSAGGNRSGSAGGAIYAVNDVTVNGDAELTDNTAAGSGGGFSVTGNAMVAGNLTADGNKAGSHGGVIHSSGGVSVGGAAKLTNNEANSNGGAIYAAGDITLYSAKAVSGNRAGKNGGALWSGGNITLNAASAGLLANDNRAGGLGGVIYMDSAVLALNAIDGDITFSGNMHSTASTPRANAIFIDNGDGDSSLSLNAVAGRRIVFYDPVQNNGANGLVSVTKDGLGTVSFDGMNYADSADRWSQVFGDTTVSAGTFEIANNAVYGALSTDAATPTAATSFTSAAGTMVQGGLVGTIRADNVAFDGNLSIAGRHSPRTEYSTFNVVANGATFGGGTIYFNTLLNDGESQHSDLLVLNLNGATASGQAFLHVAAMPGSPGAYIPGNGIMLIRTDSGTTPNDTFMLGNRVAAGAYDYFLKRGGRDDDPQNANNWYLRNEPLPIPPEPEPEPDPAPAPPRPEVPTNAVILPLALQYGYAMLDTLHERVGETWTSPLAPVTEERVVRCNDRSANFRCTVRIPMAGANGADIRNRDEARWAKTGWARLIGNRSLRQPDNYWKSGPNYDYTFGGIQAGLDIYAREQSDGTLDKVGIYVGYGQIEANVRGLPGAYYGPKAGTVDMDAYTLGGYWTHFSPAGWYTDAVIQGTWYTNTKAKSVLNETLEPDGFGILGSLEAGYSFKLGSGWTLEPQAQIVYQNVTFDDTHDSFGKFRFQDGDSLRGRLGIRLTKTWNMAEENKQPRLITGWLRANVWHEFLGNTKTTVASFSGDNPVTTPSSLKGTWGELGAGVTAQVSEHVSLFATGAYQRSLDNKGAQSWDGRLGMTIRW